MNLSLPENKARDFVTGVLGAVEAARKASAPQLRSYRIGGANITMQYLSSVLLERFAPAFDHLAIDDSSEPAAVITIADQQTVIADLPGLPWPVEEYRAGGEVRGFVEGAYYTHLNVAMSALTVLDEPAGRAAYLCRQPERLPSYETAGPLRAFIQRYFVRSRGMPILHAGAVAHGGKAALLFGNKGAGKSTTTLSCLAAGFGYLGDDKILLDPAGPTAHSVYSSTKFFLDDLQKLPLKDLDKHLHLPVTADDRKAMVYIHDLLPNRIVRQAPIAAMIHCSVVDSEASRLIPIDPAFALRTLVSDNIGMYPSTAAATFDAVGRACRNVPCYRLLAGRDLRGVADTIAERLAAS